MRLPTALLISALLLAPGCATTRPSDRAASTQQWQRLCDCMRRPQSSSPAGSIPPRALTDRERERLRTVAHDATASVVQIRVRLKPRTAAVHHDEGAREASTSSGGTGVVISSDGLILTNAHVVHSAADIVVVLHDGSLPRVERVVTDPYFDLAILRVVQWDLQPLRPVEEPVTPGTPVVAIGTPTDGGSHSCRPGLLTARRASLQDALDPAGNRCYDELIESTTQLEPGFSGGPLVNAHGQLVGLNTAVVGDTDSDRCRGYAIPLNEHVLEIVARLSADVVAGKERRGRPRS